MKEISELNVIRKIKIGSLVETVDGIVGFVTYISRGPIECYAFVNDKDGYTWYCPLRKILKVQN